MRILAASLLVLLTAIPARAELAPEASVERPPQFVLLAFDGSRNINFWKKSRAFARETGVRFTYFISGVYFLARKDRREYREPKRGRGRSAIGFGGKRKHIAERVEQVALAISEGHEIASHANGHFNGSSYSASQWNSEFEQFESIMANSWSRYSKLKEPVWWRSHFKTAMKGHRAPLLGLGSGLYKALNANGYTYDTSRIAKRGYWPKKINGIWNFPLASLRISGSRRRTLSMDYNFYVADSGARRGSSSRFGRYEERMFKTYMDYFRHNYSGDGNRAPIDIGHHFSAWNGASYWRAMKRFARAVCGKPEVICATYGELQKFLEENQHNLEQYRKGNFRRTPDPSTLYVAYAKPPEPTHTYRRETRTVIAAVQPKVRVRPKKAVAEAKPKKAIVQAKPEKAVVQAKQDTSKGTKRATVVAERKSRKDKRVVYDAGFRRPDLRAMTKVDRKAYWTRVWYARNKKKPPQRVLKAYRLAMKRLNASADVN